MELSTASLLKVAPTAEERTLVHNLFLNTLDTRSDLSSKHRYKSVYLFCAYLFLTIVTFSPNRTVSFRSRILMPNSMWMEDAKMKGLEICHPQVSIFYFLAVLNRLNWQCQLVHLIWCFFYYLDFLYSLHYTGKKYLQPDIWWIFDEKGLWAWLGECLCICVRVCYLLNITCEVFDFITCYICIFQWMQTNAGRCRWHRISKASRNWLFAIAVLTGL